MVLWFFMVPGLASYGVGYIIWKVLTVQCVVLILTPSITWSTFQVGRSSLEQPCHFGLILAIKRVIFGPLEPWIGAWKGQIWP